MKKFQNNLIPLLQEILDEASKDIEPRLLFPRVVYRKNNALYIRGKDSKTFSINLDYERIIIVGGGKISHHLAEYISEILSDKIIDGIIASKVETKQIEKIRFIQSSHPNADEKSLHAANEMIKILKSANEKTLVIFLISGGCSSLLAKSIPEINFRQKVELVKKLLFAGADIYELNTFRKYFSSIKGGGILKYFNSDFISLIVSDVVDNSIETIASGLTYYSKPTNTEVEKILNKYDLYNELPENIKKLLMYDYWKNFNRKNEERNFIIFDNSDFQKIIMMIAKNKNIIVHKIRKPIIGDVNSAAEKLKKIYYRIFNRIKKRKGIHLIISGGETTVSVKGNGLGGRNHELSLLMMKYISGFSNAAFMSLATDGDDGNSNHAGAYVYNGSVSECKKLKFNIESFKNNNDSYSLFSKMNNEANFPKFITNVMDIQLMLIKIK